MSIADQPLGDIATNFLLENSKVKIWNLIVGPGESSNWHLHERDYVTIVVEGGGLTVEFEDGTTEEGSSGVGAWTYHYDHRIHRVINKSGVSYKSVLVELKG